MTKLILKFENCCNKHLHPYDIGKLKLIISFINYDVNHYLTCSVCTFDGPRLSKQKNGSTSDGGGMSSCHVCLCLYKVVIGISNTHTYTT